MNEQQQARQFGSYDFVPADLGNDKISQMSRKYRELVDRWDRTDGVKRG